MADARQTGSWRYLPLVLALTACIIGAPLAAIAWVELTYGVRLDPIPAAALAVALSAALGTAGSAIWIRHPRSRDIVFGDLMLWGYVRRLINGHRVLRATASLGLDRSDGNVREITLSPERQTEILQKLAHALEANDPYTHGHSRRVARHSLMVAKTMGLPAEYVEKVFTAASVHDVGKVRLPAQVLNKPGKLTDDEFEIIKEHPAMGAEMVSDLDNGEITEIVRHHHERLDGRGYPDRLGGDAIPLGSRIIAVADTFDALTSTRAYRKASEHKVALDILKKEAGSQLDGSVVEAFLRYYSGRRSRTWWSAITAIPERLLGRIGSGVEKIGVASLANGVTAAGAAVVIAGASLGTPVPPDDMQRATQTTAATQALAQSSDDERSTSEEARPSDAPDRDDRKDRKDRSGSEDGSARDGSGSSGSGSGSSGSGSGGSGSGTDDGGSGSGSGSDGSGSSGSDSGSASGSDGSGSSGSGSSGSSGSDSGSGSSGSGSGSSGSDSSGSGSSGSDSSGSGSSGSGSDSSGSGSGGSGGGGGLLGGLLDTVGDVGCGLLGC